MLGANKKIIMHEIEFELVENNATIKYKYLGDIGHADLGLNFEYPSENTKSAWYKTLVNQNDCKAAACIGSLTYNLEVLGKNTFIETFADIHKIVNSELFIQFTNKWFDLNGSLFREPFFFDGFFGRFSDDSLLSRADNADDGWNTRWTWGKEDITLIFNEECGYGDWKNGIFIDASIEDEFKSELNAIIELFNT